MLVEVWHVRVGYLHPSLEGEIVKSLSSQDVFEMYVLRLKCCFSIQVERLVNKLSPVDVETKRLKDEVLATSRTAMKTFQKPLFDPESMAREDAVGAFADRLGAFYGGLLELHDLLQDKNEYYQGKK